MSEFDHLPSLSDERLAFHRECCLTENKRLLGKKGKQTAWEARRNAEVFDAVTREMKRRGLDG